MTCGKTKATLQCGICHEPLCKSCTQFLDEGQFSFLPRIPRDLTYHTYCDTCFTAKVATALADYDQKLLAFLASLEKCNAVIDVDLKSKKVRAGSYQTTVWSGSGMPANVSDELLVKDRSIWDDPN